MEYRAAQEQRAFYNENDCKNNKQKNYKTKWAKKNMYIIHKSKNLWRLLAKELKVIMQNK